MQSNEQLINVIYDGIEHSIFESQILAPLLKRLRLNKSLHVLLVSFETKNLSETTIHRLNKAHPRFAWKVIKRGPFIGFLSLYSCARSFKAILEQYHSYQLIARGPLAGRIATQAIGSACTHYTIQARGLLAAEYAYTHKDATGLFFYLTALRSYQLAYHEKKAYTPHFAFDLSFSIEVVSTALKEHLKQTYGLQETNFTLAELDTPKTIKPAVRTALRSKLRKQLGVTEHTHVYVYNGSAKSWQCPKETVSFFKKIVTKDPHSFLLILSTEPKLFKKLCKQNKIPSKAYTVLYVSYESLHHYLCAADTGLLFREKHLINWVSRPTKYLEYKAAGLSVIHNNTIAYLEQDS